MSEKESIPWKRLSAETIAIVGSILLAFSIDAWWEESREREEEREILAALQEELKHNTGLIEVSSEFHNALLEVTRELLEGAVAERVFSEEELESLLGTIYWVNTTELATGVYQSLVQGGQLSLVENTALRGRIASLMTDYEEMLVIERWHSTTFEEQFMPYLKNKIDMAKLMTASRIKPTETEPRYPTIPAIGIETRVNMIRDPELHHILLLQISNHFDALHSFNKARVTLDALIADIDVYLGRQ